MDMKNAFFDKKAVVNSVDKATRTAISKSLAFVRRRQRSIIRRRKRPSRPGQPPSAHSRDQVATVKNILFAYDQRTKSGVVGMVKINGRQSAVSSGMELPGLLEAGGTVSILETSWNGVDWSQPSPRQMKRIDPRQRTRKRSVRIAKRPSAGPALQMEADAGNILSPWANVVTG